MGCGLLVSLAPISLSAQAQQRGPPTRGPAAQGEVPGRLCDPCQWLLNLPPHQGSLRSSPGPAQLRGEQLWPRPPWAPVFRGAEIYS